MTHILFGKAWQEGFAWIENGAVESSERRFVGFGKCSKMKKRASKNI